MNEQKQGVTQWTLKHTCYFLLYISFYVFKLIVTFSGLIPCASCWHVVGEVAAILIQFFYGVTVKYPTVVNMKNVLCGILIALLVLVTTSLFCANSLLTSTGIPTFYTNPTATPTPSPVFTKPLEISPTCTPFDIQHLVIFTSFKIFLFV
jgi:hypothetical protein